MSQSIYPLTKQLIIDNIELLVTLSKSIHSDYWKLDNYLIDLPHKWKFSLVVLNENNKIIGFVISSYRSNCLHINRIVISEDEQKKGLGNELLSKLKTTAIKNSIKTISLKVHVDNLKAINWYKKHQFEFINSEGEYNLMHLSL